LDEKKQAVKFTACFFFSNLDIFVFYDKIEKRMVIL